MPPSPKAKRLDLMRAARPALPAVLLGVAAAAAQSPPRFPARADVVSVDASVVDSDGRPIRDLASGDFEVEVDGRPRRVLSADFIDYGDPSPPEVGTSPVTTSVTTSEARARRRLILIAVDRGELSAGGIHWTVEALTSLLDRLGPEDQVAVISLPTGPRLEFTAERAAVKATLERIGPGRDDGIAFALPQRERLDASMISAMDRLDVLEAVLGNLVRIGGPKSLVLVSGGMTAGDTSPEVVERLRRIVTAAAASRTTLYSLFISQRGREGVAEKSYSATLDPLGDPQFRAATIEHLTSMSGGALFEVVAGADHIVARLADELSGQYLLGLEPADGDRDGKPHEIKVRVRRSGVTVRARRQFVIAPAPPRPARPAPAEPSVAEEPAFPPVGRAATFSERARRIEDVRRFASEGDRLLAAEAFEDAAKAYADAIALEPLHVMAYYGLGRARMAQKDYAAAVAAFETARRAFVERARVLRARRAVRRPRPVDAVRTPPPGLIFALGSAYFRSGRIADAEREYRAALDADPKLGEARVNLAVVLLMTGRPAAAREQIALAKKAGAKVPAGLEKDVERALAGG